MTSLDRHPAPAIPWHHPTQAALAKALGVSLKTLDDWKARSAPLDAPLDELAVRLWHAAQSLSGKTVTLKAPADSLARYLALAAAAVAAQRDADVAAAGDPGNLVKLGQAKKLDIANRKAEQLLLDQAKEAYKRWTGDLTRVLARSFTVSVLGEIWQAAQVQRLRAESEIKRRILAACEGAIVASLADITTEVAKAKAKR